jgi:hypothetical protein
VYATTILTVYATAVLSSADPDDEEPRVVHLKLQKNNLNGYVPESIGSLDALTHFWADGNVLTGQIPRNIASCVALVSTIDSAWHITCVAYHV